MAISQIRTLRPAQGEGSDSQESSPQGVTSEHVTFHGKGANKPGGPECVLTLWFSDGLSQIIQASRQSQCSLKAGEEGWRDSVMAKSSNCFRRRPEFRSSHLHGG